MSDEKIFTFEDGLPTKPDVDLLLRTWPDPKSGQTFSYEAVARLIGADAHSNRFRTVTWNWRKRLLERGIVIECSAGSHFYVANTDQITASTYGALSTIKRKAHSQRRKLAAANPESDAQRACIEHQGRLMLAIERDAKKARMNVLPSTQVQAPPMITAPAKDAAK